MRQEIEMRERGRQEKRRERQDIEIDKRYIQERETTDRDKMREKR